MPINRFESPAAMEPPWAWVEQVLLQNGHRDVWLAHAKQFHDAGWIFLVGDVFDAPLVVNESGAEATVTLRTLASDHVEAATMLSLFHQMEWNLMTTMRVLTNMRQIA